MLGMAHMAVLWFLQPSAITGLVHVRHRRGCAGLDYGKLGPTVYKKVPRLVPWDNGQRTYVQDLTKREVCWGPRRMRGYAGRDSTEGSRRRVVVVVLTARGSSPVLA